MAVQLDTVTVAKFEDLFQKPSIERFLKELTDSEFEDFIGYVFTCAGYRTENVANHHFPHGPGVDLQIYRNMGEKGLSGRVEVKHYKEQVSYGTVKEFVGVLDRPPIVPGYLVTTGGFSQNAYDFVAEARKQVYLVDGEHLIRYITYIRGSRMSGMMKAPITGGSRLIQPKFLFEGDEIAKAASVVPRASIIAVANNKGGVAKTTTALNLGFALASQEQQRVLVIDMDGQASLTRSLPGQAPKGEPVPENRPTLASYMTENTPLGQLIRSTCFTGLDLNIIPSSSDLHRVDSGGSGRPEVELQFIRDLHALARETREDGTLRYQWIILDTPPAQSLLTRLAIGAADRVLMPFMAETYAGQGLNAVKDTVQTMHALTDSNDTWKQRIHGALLTKYKKSANADAALGTVSLELNAAGITLIQVPIPHDEKVEKAIREEARGLLSTIFGNRNGNAAAAYSKIAKELMTWQPQSSAN